VVFVIFGAALFIAFLAVAVAAINDARLAKPSEKR
jgi:hypothetical protein